MATLAEIRQQYPQYDTMPDEELAGKLYEKFYVGKIDRAEFDKKLGLGDGDWYRSTVLPMATNQKTGEHKWDVPGIIREPYNAVERFMQGGERVPSQNPELIPDALTTATLATPMNPAVRSGARAIEGVARAPTKLGSAYPAETLKATSGKQFQAFRNTDIKIDPNAVKGFVATVRQKLMEDGFLEPEAASTYAVLSALEKAPEGGWLSAAGLHSVYKSLNRVAGNYRNPSDQGAASRTVQALEEFFRGLPEAGFLASATPPRTAKEIFQSARGNYAAAKQSEKITGKVDAAELRAASANSGRNIDNAIRQRIAGLLLNPAARRGLKPQEIAELEKVVKGGAVTNFARTTANLFGGGGGMGQVVTGAIAGAAVGAGAGIVPGLLVGTGIAGMGRALKGAENQLTKRRVRAVDEQVRARAPMGRQQEFVGKTAKPVFTRGVLSNAVTPREESLKHATNIVGPEVMARIKSSINTRGPLNDWLKARASGKNLGEATQMLASAIMSELKIEDPTVYDRIINELNQTRGP